MATSNHMGPENSAERDNGAMPLSAKERRKALTQKLRRLFDDVASEPLPDRLRELLEKLNEKRAG